MNSEIINFPKNENPSGNYAIIEGNTLPFDIKRVYYLYEIPSEFIQDTVINSKN